MSELTLDEAIKHCLEVAEDNETKAQKIGVQFLGTTKDKEATDCRECAADHRQLAEWLTELKELRNSIGAVKLKDMKEAVGLLQELNAENDQLTSQLAEAKWLLKSAVEDIHELLCDKKNLDGNGQSCNICSYIEWCPCCKECTIREDLRNWRYADEALKLIES